MLLILFIITAADTMKSMREMITERKRIMAVDNERDIAITLGNLISRVINDKTLSKKG